MRYLALSLAAALLFAACGDEVPPPATQTASPTATASPVPSVTGLPLDLPALTLAPAVALPPDIALLLETGCFRCDGPATGLIRVSRSADGASTRDLLLSAGAHPLYGASAAESLYFAGDIPIPRNIVETSKDKQQYDPYVTGIATSGDGSEIVVSVCVYPGCGVGMDWSADGRVALYRSVDGGETWADFGTINGGGVLGIVSPGRILALSPVGSDGSRDVFLYPGHELVPRAPTTQGVYHPPMILADGTIAWPDWGGALERPDGSPVLALPDFVGSRPVSIGPVVQQSFGDRLIAVLWVPWNLPEWTTFVSLFQADGTHLRTATLGRIGGGVAWVSDTELIANVSVTAEELGMTPPAFYPGVLPALIDLDAGTISPIVDPFLEPGAEMGRNNIRGVQLSSPAQITHPSRCAAAGEGCAATRYLER